MKNSYTITRVYGEHTLGRNWVSCHLKVEHAVHELLEHFENCEWEYSRGEYDMELDDFENYHLVFDSDGSVVFDCEQAHKYIGQSWTFGDYTIKLGKV
jgi:hypothetical protein